LFKYVNVSPLPDTPRPSIFDFTGRAKWDAWNTAGKTYSDKAQAQSRYLQIARNLGWTEGLVPETAAAGETEDIWDYDDSDEAPSPSSRSRGGGAGFGTSVSSMAPPEDNDDTSIHGLAVSNNLTGLISFLREDPSANLNARDPFVNSSLLSFLRHCQTVIPGLYTSTSRSRPWQFVYSGISAGERRGPIDQSTFTLVAVLTVELTFTCRMRMRCWQLN
jgi:hypothetical protein